MEINECFSKDHYCPLKIMSKKIFKKCEGYKCMAWEPTGIDEVGLKGCCSFTKVFIGNKQ